MNVHCGWQLRTPGWIRTSGFDTRNVALFPLSYEGMTMRLTWTVGESNPAHQACKARLCTSTQPINTHIRTLAGTRTRTVGVLNTAPLPLGHEGITRADRGDRTRVFGLEDRHEHQPHQIRTVIGSDLLCCGVGWHCPPTPRTGFAADAGLEPAFPDRESGGLPIAEPALYPQHVEMQSEARESNSVCPVPKTGGSTSSLAPE